MGLSTLVQEQNVVRWTQPDMVDTYIRRLQTSVQRFAALNEQLTQCHQQVEEKVRAKWAKFLPGINFEWWRQ